MNDSRETHTLDERGKALTVEQQGHSAPADYSFSCVNDYVHAHDRQFEELQYLALGMANEIEKLTKALIALLDALDSSRSCQYKALREDGRKVIAGAIEPTCKRDKKPCGAGGYCLECPSGPRREWTTN